MGNVFSQGALFDAPPVEGEPVVERRTTGIVHRASREPARAAREPRDGGGGSFVTTESHGNLYSSMIDFRPNIGTPVDTPQVAATRARLVEGKGENR
jgi:hypothetical protein